MRALVFFDLLVLTQTDRREYARFRRFLLKSGFMLLQESVYCKICQNGSGLKSTIDHVRENSPPKGLVQILTVTERQYLRMEYLTGVPRIDVITNDKRTVVL